jgi:hypothetical protein
VNLALAGDAAVIDTSALHLLGRLGLQVTRLTAQFDRRLMPASLRNDVLHANANLALRSTGNLGWDPARQRPVLTEVPKDVVDGWSTEAQLLVDRLSLVDVVPDSPNRSGTWDSAILLAKDLQIPLWADDVAIRQLARTFAVPAFGTLDLINILVERGELGRDAAEQALDALVDARAVDLPVLDRLTAIARQSGWHPDGYAALLLTRPRSWVPQRDGLARYIAFMRALPNDIEDTALAQWAEAAATGLAWATPPPARPRVVASLLAWTILNSGREDLMPAIVDVGQRVQAASAPDGDILAHLINCLAETITAAADPATTGIVMTRMLGHLDTERRTAAMRLFLNPPRSSIHPR